MRNLKRVLSLALALVMVLGMMVITTSAATFTDAAEIDPAYEEAVAVMSGIGLFQGNDDGTLAPKQELNRAMAATIMARIMLGSKYENLSDDTARQIFSDVPAGEWYSAEIEYCYNNELIGGLGDGTFDPNGKLTGVAFAKLLLVAMGYNAETEGYTGPNWATGIYADAVDNGLDIEGVDMAGALTREQAAQMIFQALEAETVKYNNLEKGAFADGNTFMGKWYPKLSKFEGVVTANEYANLYGRWALGYGKTEIDGVRYNLSTEITDIGESRQGWAYGKDVIYIEDTGDNTVFETGAETSFVNPKTGRYDGAVFTKVTGMYDYADYFVNFDYNSGANYTSDYMITYGYLNDELENGTAAPHTEKTRRAGQSINADELADVFADNNGYVYVGTKNTDNDEDKSSTMSWKAFKAAYLNQEDFLYAFNSSNNGEWLKVIDNDGDYCADYVLKTTFTMDMVTDITTDKQGVTTWELAGTEIDDSYYYVDADGVAEYDVVLYTRIDGTYYIDVAEVVVDTVEEDGYSKKNNTLTCAENTFEESGINYVDFMECDKLAEADEKVSYDFYLDHFGYVRMFEQSAWSKGFVLLTDGYFESDKRADDVYMAEIWNGKYEDVVVLENDPARDKNDLDDAVNFINPIDEEGEKDWARLYTAEEVYKNTVKSDFATNIAGFSVNEKGEYTLVVIDGNSISNKVVYTVEELALDLDGLNRNDTLISDKTLVDADNEDVQATTDTVYYFVEGTDKRQTITSWTGYKNAPKGLDLADYETVIAYAVTVAGAKNAYDVAEIIVFEANGNVADEDMYFVYDADDYDVTVIGYDTEDEAYVAGMEVDTEEAAPIDFWYINTDEEAEVVTDYAAEGIFAGEVLTAYYDVGRRDYVKFTFDGDVDYIYEDETPVFALETKGRAVVADVMDYSDIAMGDELIVVTATVRGVTYVEYVINVTASEELLDDLYLVISDPEAVEDAEAEATLAEAQAAIEEIVAAAVAEADLYGYTQGVDVVNDDATEFNHAGSDMTMKDLIASWAGSVAGGVSLDVIEAYVVEHTAPDYVAALTAVLTESAATVDGEYYETLAEAIAAAAAAEEEVTVVLANDVTETVVIEDAGDVVIDLNGCDITGADADGYAIRVKGETVLTIEGKGTVTGTGTYGIAVRADGAAKVIINSGDFTNIAADSAEDYQVVYAADGGTVVINGGTFKCEGNSTTYTLNLKDNTGAHIVVKGGSFYEFDPSNSASENPVADFTYNGTTVTEDDDGWFIVE